MLLMARTAHTPALAAALCLLLALTACPTQAETGRIRVLAMGWLDWKVTVLNTFRHDPLVACSMVPSNFRMADWDQQMVKMVGGRMVRQYFPRSRATLVESYDFFIYEDTWLDPYRPEQVADMRYAIEEKGLGAFVTLGNSLSGSTAWGWYGWHHSALRELMPTEFTEKMSTSPSARYAGFRVKVLRNDPPVLAMFKPFGIESVAGTGNAWSEPRMGSTVWADMVHAYSSPTGSKAFLISWKVGGRGGHFWTVADNLFSLWWAPYHNEYAQDVLVNILLYSTGRDLPEDIVVVHSIRRQYWLYAQYGSYIQSLLTFVEKFGANTQRLAREIDEIDQGRKLSFEQFREGQYEQALGTIRLAMTQLEGLEAKAFDLKDATLFWVYVIQWTAVTSVLLITGVVLWSLMVRRRLYREVHVTKLAQEQTGRSGE